MPYIGKSPSAGVRQRYQYTATAGQTTFSGTDLGNLTLTYTDNNFVDVFQNGVLLKGGGTDYTATSGTSVVLTTGASVSDVIEIIVYDVFSVGNFYNRTDSDSRYVNVDGDTMTGEFKANGGVVFNEDSADVDFRVESNGNTHALFVDGGNDHVNINTSSDLGSDLNINGEVTIANANSGIIMVENAADAFGSNFTMRKSRNTTLNAHTVVQDDDVTGNINFQGSDGTDFHSTASIASAVDGTPGNNDMPGRLTFSTTADGASSPTERMRILGGGGDYILVGKTTTASGEQKAGFMIGHNGASSTNGRIIVSSKNHNAFARLDSNGEVIKFYRSSTDFSATEVGSIDVDGSSTTYGVSSDYRLKENIVTDWDATTRLKQLKPSRFNFKVDKDKTVDGFLAHEVSSIVPEAVRGEKDAVDEDGNIKTQKIDHSKLVPLLTKALQEAVAKIETLEAKVTALESE